MSEHNPEWSEFGDLVIATIEKVMDYGAYAKLDEYNRQGFLHISEIKTRFLVPRNHVKLKTPKLNFT
jgi:translation initiation factor 2 subunit 1